VNPASTLKFSVRSFSSVSEQGSITSFFVTNTRTVLLFLDVYFVEFYFEISEKRNLDLGACEFLFQNLKPNP